MAKRHRRARPRQVVHGEVVRYNLDEYLRQRVAAIESGFAFAQEPSYATVRGHPVERAEDYASLASYAYRGDSVVAACMRVRRDLFRQARFCWRTLSDSGPGRVFRTPELRLLERPWPNGTTGELLARMVTDVDLCGNSFIANEGERLRWLRPDWVSIVLSGDPLEDPFIDVLGYIYTPGGQDPERGVPYLPEEICHWSPEQDPMAQYRGMSWVSKALEDVTGDRAATTHKLAFFRNGATLGPIVRVPAGMTLQQFKDFVAAAEAAHAGAANAYRTMYVGGGAEVTLAAADFKQLDLKAVQGGYETRIAAVAGVHPTLVGLSEGMQGSSLNAGNFTAARRLTAEMTLFALWQDACGALQAFFDPADDTELWIREKDIPFLREERKDQAEITNKKVLTLEAGIRAGYTPDALVDAVEADDITLLKGKHTGLTSVQLLPPGAEDTDGDGSVDQVAEDEAPTPEEAAALRALIDAVDDDDIFRARLLDVAEISRRYNRGQLRVGAGQSTGGQWTKIATSVMADLAAWLAGGAKPGTDPLAGYNQRQLKSAATQLGLNPPRGMRLVPLKALLIAHARTQRGAPGPSPSQQPPGLPPGHKKVAANVAGTTGVTQVAVTPPATFGVPSWMIPTETLEIHLNGTKIGKLERYSYGWSSTSAAGNPVLTGRTKTAAMQGLVQHHQQMQALKALKTSVPGATLSRAPQVFGNSPDHYRVDVGGVDVGGVHGDDSDPNGGWVAFPPTGAAYGLQANPGSGQSYSTKDEAVQGLVDAHNAYQASIAPPPPAPAGAAVAIKRLNPGASGPTKYDVTVNGTSVGMAIGSRAGWTAHDPSGAGLGVFKSRKDAVDALVAQHQATQVPQPPPLTQPSSQADPAVKAVQDVLYGVDPKAKTATRQLQVYGALTKTQYDTLDTREQSTLLGDLSFIATTSKGPNSAKAQKLIDRFTPAGTPSGTVPKQAVMPPASVASAQTRVADPTGTPGLLKMLPASQRGSSGDGWTRTTSGGSGPWGQYGAAGLMLRHVDGQGTERFLMIERGAGISDPYKWQFPGGAKDEREDFYQGAAREVIEELGFKATDLDLARVHGTHTYEAPNVMVRGLHGGQVPWGYVSIAATVPSQLKPDLSTSHARLETNDAKWMTRTEIEALDRQGKLLKPLAGGQLQANVISLFPTTGPPRPAPRTTRPARLTGTPSTAAPLTAHKTHRGSNLVATKAEQDQVRSHVSANRKRYRKKTGDERLSVLAEMQGFDGTPTVHTKAEIDRLLKTGDYVEAWRGVSGGWTSGNKTAAQINEDMRSGIAWFGTGVFGNGYYLATDKSVARQYADGTKNSIARVLIPKSAITRKPEQIKVLADATSSSNQTIYNGHRQGNGLGTLRDPGRYMAAAGIDGMEIPHDTRVGWASARHIASAGHPAYNWVNRTVLIVQEADP